MGTLPASVSLVTPGSFLVFFPFELPAHSFQYFHPNSRPLPACVSLQTPSTCWTVFPSKITDPPCQCFPPNSRPLNAPPPLLPLQLSRHHFCIPHVLCSLSEKLTPNIALLKRVTF